ncbi:hypothetical protein BD324DRAFT_593880 [Kockovaella imperatae]|uniref:Uncharacterized protein n=1 Tax=Kockovaella imperatae TaxID=4999 RepID=A0A1Y1U9T0_9TREE|nr:hypothetical protein BD324DRAFT_593880 [Kockovaella imperatae]ORX34788.1 hypothetical protein BD324DRAFT_593880 [Kockovaella imperatae]
MALSGSFRATLAEPIPSDPPRFVVGGQTGSASGDVKMYEWHRTRGEMRLLGLQTDVGQLRAVAWSPLPTHRHIVAAGLSTGRTLIISLSPQTLSVNVPANLGTPSSSTSTSTAAVLALKNPRSSTCVAFSPLDPNYLATGYDRHRSDYSLLVWDISAAMSLIPPDTQSAWHRPLERLEVTTARTTTGGLSEDSKPTEPRHIQQYCASEQVNDVAFLPSAYNILASTNNKQIRMFDLRAPNSGQTPDPSNNHVSMQWITRAVQSLSPDPSAPYRFASYESSNSGSTVRMWDTRKSGAELLSLDISGAILGISWAQGGSGVSRLGVGTKDGVSVWEVINGRTVGDDGTHEWTSLGEMKQVIRAKQNLQSFTFSQSSDKHRPDIFFVLKDGSLNVGSLSSAPKVASGARGDMAIVSKDAIVVDPRISTDAASDEQSLDSEDEGGTITRANPFQLQPARVSTILAEAQSSRPVSPAPSTLLRGMRRGPPLDPEDGIHRDLMRSEHLDWRSWQRLLRSEMGRIMQRRAAEGYGVSNLQLNAAIATKYPGSERLAGVWEFVDHLIQVMNPKTSRDRSINLSHAGIYAIWTGQDLSKPTPVSPPASIRSQSTLLSESTELRNPSLTPTAREPVKQNSAAWTSLRHTQHQMPARSTPNVPQVSHTPPWSRYDAALDHEFSAAVENLSRHRDDGKRAQRLPSSSKIAQRSIILAVCGDKGSDEIHRLIEDGNRTKASCLAYFSGEEEFAIRILLHSSNSNHRLLGTTLAGFLQNTQSTRGTSSFFEEHWQTLVARVDDPYMRAVLSKVAGEGWDSVMEEEAMPLLDRLAIAVHNVNDQELGDFLSNRYSRFSRSTLPNLSNFLALLGFTSPSIQGFQRYLERTGDLQTVALLSVFFPQSRLSQREQETIRHWTEAYRSLLDSWGMWGERIDLDTRRMEIGKMLGEDRVAEEDLGSGKGICPVCSNALSKAHEEHLQGATKNRVPPKQRQANCTYCGQALPRCVICLRHVESMHRDDWDEWVDIGDTIDQAYVCCLTCRHGGHANHILPWFEGEQGEGGNSVCPVSGCDCHCAEI